VLARQSDAETLGVAGGDGSLAAVAEVTIERGVPFVCVPFGTRNHFARDLGLDRADPRAALAAFEGEERRVDVGRVGDRLFLNNVSFGAYASLVHRREHDRRRREAFAGVRALVLAARHPHLLGLTVNGEAVAGRVILVANNAYELRLFDLGARPTLSGGRLHLYWADGVLPATWNQRTARRSHSRAAGPSPPRSTANPSSWIPPSTSASSRARYVCWCRQASSASATQLKASSRSGGSRSGSNQRSAETSSAARGSPPTTRAVQNRLSVVSAVESPP
jgi:Diacylglycerol kinase catalytic domain